MKCPNPLQTRVARQAQINDVPESARRHRGCLPRRQDSTMPSTKELTIEEAETLARRMDTRREAWAGIMRAAADLSGRFSDATATDVVRMWKSGRNEKGRPLSKFE